MTPARTQFWSESVFSKAGSTIPARLRKGNEAVKWSIDGVLGELLREPGHCGHVINPLPPVHVFGIEPGKLRVREQQLYAAASKITKPYKMKDGRVFQRGQPASEPILLVAVASWPEPTMQPSPERERWQRRVVRAARSRWGHRLRGVYAHVDETFYHLHLWVDDEGAPVKGLHAGHGAVMDQPKGTPRKLLAEAYKSGCRMAQDWYHHWVGSGFGWARNLAPRPRLARGAAARRRQQELEEREELAARQLARNKAEKAALDEADASIREATAHAMETLKKLEANRLAWEAEKQRQKAELSDALARLWHTSREIHDQAGLEKRLEGLGIDPVLFGELFR